VPQLIPQESLLDPGWLASRVVCEGDAESGLSMTLPREVSAELIREGEDQFESERGGSMKIQCCWESSAIIRHGQAILTMLVIHRHMDGSFATIREAVFQRIGDEFMHDQSTGACHVRIQPDVVCMGVHRNRVGIHAIGMTKVRD